jgi:hypothetical protein
MRTVDGDALDPKVLIAAQRACDCNVETSRLFERADSFEEVQGLGNFRCGVLAVAQWRSLLAVSVRASVAASLVVRDVRFCCVARSLPRRYFVFVHVHERAFDELDVCDDPRFECVCSLIASLQVH